MRNKITRAMDINVIDIENFIFNFDAIPVKYGAIDAPIAVTANKIVSNIFFPFL